jgi:dephospho-CoA kinase
LILKAGGGAILRPFLLMVPGEAASIRKLPGQRPQTFSAMLTYALTGGIATGKSTLCRLIVEEIPGVKVFDSDASVRALLEADAGVAAEVRRLFGPEALTPLGTVDRGVLRSVVFSNPEARALLEGLLHPRVREDCLASRELAAKDGASIFLADIPLLFEKNFSFGQERSLISATTRATQVSRLKARNGFDDDLIDSILNAQLPLDDKIRRADVVFWNEGPLSVLRRQVRRFSLYIP